MIKILLSISLLGILPAQAMDDPQQNQRHLGRYPLYQEGEDGTIKGNATLFRTEDGKCFGITCAHCVPYLDSLSYVTVEELQDAHTLVTYFPIGNIRKHPLYKEESINSRNNFSESRRDIALFTINNNTKLTYFPGKISTDELMENREYPILVTSFGPLFSKDFSSYEESKLHQLNCSLKFSEEGLLFHPFQSRSFYLSFLPTQDDKFTLYAGLLSGPEETNLLSGDSGSLAINAEGKAMALASVASRDATQLVDLLHLEDHFRDYSDLFTENYEEISYDKILKNKLLQTIEEGIADFIDSHKNYDSEEKIYVFKLKEGVPTIEGKDYYTSLSLHSDFINQYIRDIPDFPLEGNNGLPFIKVNKDRDMHSNPELVEEYMNVNIVLAHQGNFLATLRAQLSPESLADADSFEALFNQAAATGTPSGDDATPSPNLDEGSPEDKR